MNRLINKRILLGVTGSIAAYKSAELVRLLREAGAEVQVVMTAGAARFVTALTFQALSGRAVRDSLLDPAAEAAMGHIELARWADAVLVAPCSADFLARLAQGRADDLLATLCLATEAPIAVAPAMNRVMWGNAATGDNVARLRARGVAILGPAEGGQACGETGPGRMLEPTDLAGHLDAMFDRGDLAGLRLLVTAGPTREPLDPVRYLSNRSSGKMGFAVARAAAEAGAAVTLVSGPVGLATPPGVERIDVETTEQMYDAVLARAGQCEIFIGVAAVADYRPRQVAPGKLKRRDASLELQLERTPDVLAAVASLPERPFTVGFAAETGNLLDYARGKLQAKGLDMIAANNVGAGLGFDREDNALEVLWPDGAASLERAAKPQLARRLISLIAARYHAKGTTQGSGSAYRA
ncbi:MAG: bifunctional phosphopantothenoylcysteine decarboxylase/phosphopantothenate--cysteine ligase CoaBC [Gammaproteobacteria bacterium]